MTCKILNNLLKYFQLKNCDKDFDVEFEGFCSSNSCGMGLDSCRPRYLMHMLPGLQNEIKKKHKRNFLLTFCLLLNLFPWYNFVKVKTLKKSLSVSHQTVML